jgi:hypothetical protein
LLEGEREKLAALDAKLSLSDDRVHELTAEADKLRTALHNAESRAAAAIENAARLKQALADASAKADMERERCLRAQRTVQHLSRRVGQLTHCSAEEVLANLDDPTHPSNKSVAAAVSYNAPQSSTPPLPAAPAYHSSHAQPQSSAAARRQAQNESQLHFNDPVDTRPAGKASRTGGRASLAPSADDRPPAGVSASRDNYDDRPIRSSHSQQQHQQLPQSQRPHARQSSSQLSSHGSYDEGASYDERDVAPPSHRGGFDRETRQQHSPQRAQRPAFSFNQAPPSSRGGSRPAASFLPDSFNSELRDEDDESRHRPSSRDERGSRYREEQSPRHAAPMRRSYDESSRGGAAPQRPVPPFAHHDAGPRRDRNDEATFHNNDDIGGDADEEAELDAMIARELQQRQELEREMQQRRDTAPPVRIGGSGLARTPPRTPPRAMPPYQQQQQHQQRGREREQSPTPVDRPLYSRHGAAAPQQSQHASVPPWSPNHPASSGPNDVRSSVHLTQANRYVLQPPTHETCVRFWCSCFRSHSRGVRVFFLFLSAAGSAPWATSVRSNGQLSAEAQVENAEEQLSELLKHKELVSAQKHIIQRLRVGPRFGKRQPS